jgi:putative transcriptional regulator
MRNSTPNDRSFAIEMHRARHSSSNDSVVQGRMAARARTPDERTREVLVRHWRSTPMTYAGKHAQETFHAILSGLEDATSHTTGRRKAAHVHRVVVRDVDVGALRERLGLTQQQFAKAFGVTTATVRNWEQGRREPKGPARVLLK